MTEIETKKMLSLEGPRLKNNNDLMEFFSFLGQLKTGLTQVTTALQIKDRGNTFLEIKYVRSLNVLVIECHFNTIPVFKWYSSSIQTPSEFQAWKSLLFKYFGIWMFDIRIPTVLSNGYLTSLTVSPTWNEHQKWLIRIGPFLWLVQSYLFSCVLKLSSNYFLHFV